MENRRSCEICANLEACDDEISALSLLQSSKNGCQLCSLLIDGISEYIQDIAEVEKLQLVHDMSIFVYVLGAESKILCVLEFYTLLDHPVLWPNIGPARRVSDNSSSDECIALAKRWLQNCLSSHSKCRRFGTPTLPTRVISVGNCDEDVKIFVNDFGMKAEYVALSHCWGGGHPVQLTSANLQEMRKHIVFGDSSKTFKEAVSVTRRLGIPYIWIDSLCILQDEDDLSDWAREAPKMGEIFNSATVTISAGSSNDTSGGLFPEVQDRKLVQNSIDLPCPAPDGQPGFVYVRARTVRPFDMNEIVHSSEELQNPRLQSRGWVLQEDHLSPRMLHFRKEELAWTCSTYSRCECRIRPSLPQAWPFRSAIGVEERSSELAYKLNLHWPSIVMEYSRRNLTKISDRVAALCGLATYTQMQTTDTYYCGLWYEDLAFQLLWYVDRPSNSALPPARFGAPYAPTWSWMSVPGAINYWNRYSVGDAPRHSTIQSDDAVESYLRVVSVGRFPVDWNNVAGPLIRGELLLYAYALPVRFDAETKQWETTQYHIDDMMPYMLRTYMDTEEDLPEHNPNRSHVFLFAGRWSGQGLTISCFEAVCILARRIPLKDIEAVKGNEGLQQEALDMMEQREDKFKEIKPNEDNSYLRVGLVRNAGSIEAWRRAEIPFEPTFLF